MKVQSINNKEYNQNNISHNAKFKVNKHFDKLYQEQIKHLDFENMAKSFREHLPNHEIEITQLKNLKNSDMRACKIVNNTTKQEYDTIIPERNNGLYYLTALIGIMRDFQFFNGVKSKESKVLF